MASQNAIMRDQSRLLLIGQVLLYALMFSGLLDMGTSAYAPNTSQCAFSACHGTSLLNEDGGDASTGSIAAGSREYSKLFAKDPKAKSTLPQYQWVPFTSFSTTPFHLRAGFPLYPRAEAYCYAIHPRPPSSLRLSE